MLCRYMVKHAEGEKDRELLEKETGREPEKEVGGEREKEVGGEGEN